jgi:uncharacterized protein involved in exopolysaccharide biosynthesis
VDSTHLLQEIVRKIFRNKTLVIVVGITLAILLFVKAKVTKAEYTSRATVFPLTNPTDNGLTSSTLSSLLGTGSSDKSFSSEASINIIELASSRNVREAVAGARIPEFGNKMVAELIVDEENDKKPFFLKKIQLPDDSVGRVVLGGEFLMTDISAKINKNDVLELNFTSTDPALVTPISNILISKISQFYINLRIEKATADYNFTIKKIDSLQKVVDSLDTKAVSLSNTTLFTPTDRLQYTLPKENLSDEKLRAGNERDININNREEALWRLQKITPIVATLDKPNPPFDIQKPSSILYAIIGFIIGCILAIIFLIAGLLYRFAKSEIHKTIFGDETHPTQEVTK